MVTLLIVVLLITVLLTVLLVIVVLLMFVVYDPHSHVHDRRGAGDHGGRRSDRSGHDDAVGRAGGRRFEDPFRSHRGRSRHDSRQGHGQAQAEAHRWRDEGDARRRPKAVHENDVTVPMVVVGLHPVILRPRRGRPAAGDPDPIAVPGPVAPVHTYWGAGAGGGGSTSIGGGAQPTSTGAGCSVGGSWYALTTG